MIKLLGQNLSRLKHQIVVITLSAAILILLILLFWTPHIQARWVKADDITPLSTPINALSQPLQFEFSSSHILNFSNGNQYTTTFYQVLSTDLSEGTNLISWQSVQDWAVIEWVSSSKELTIEVDRLPPDPPTLTAQLPVYIQLKSEISILLSGEIGTTVLNGSTNLGFLEAETSEVMLPLIDGLNDIWLVLQDQAGNQSDPLHFQIDALVRPGWSTYRCLDMVLPISDQLQVGYSHQRSSSELNYDNFQETVISNSKTCGIERILGSPLVIMPVGTEVECFDECDWPAAYISLSTESYFSGVSNSGYEIEHESPFVTRSGITGTHYITNRQNLREEWYVFEHSNQQYFFNIGEASTGYTTKQSDDLRQLVENIIIE